MARDTSPRRMLRIPDERQARRAHVHLGHKRTNHPRPKSAVVCFGPIADKHGRNWIVRFVPIPTNSISKRQHHHPSCRKLARQRAKSPDQTSFGTLGTMETPEALRSPSMPSRESRRLLSSKPFQSSFEECRFNPLARIATYPYVAGRKQEVSLNSVPSEHVSK